MSLGVAPRDLFTVCKRDFTSLEIECLFCRQPPSFYFCKFSKAGVNYLLFGVVCFQKVKSAEECVFLRGPSIQWGDCLSLCTHMLTHSVGEWGTRDWLQTYRYEKWRMLTFAKVHVFTDSSTQPNPAPSPFSQTRFDLELLGFSTQPPAPTPPKKRKNSSWWFPV